MKTERASEKKLRKKSDTVGEIVHTLDQNRKSSDAKMPRAKFVQRFEIEQLNNLIW